MPKPDHWIRERAGQMIHPFVDRKIRQAPDGWPVLSYGLSSYGYDLRLSDHDFRVFRHIPGHVVDPKAFDDRCLTQAELHTDPSGRFFMLPAHTYGLGVTVERLNIPDNVTVVFIGKSTYARSGIIINTTPGEAGWEGNLTLEISNSSDSDCRIYANEGICQALFYEGEPCDQPYGDGKYQGQGSGVTLARV